MRNLKRVLALVLALTMVLSFAISASAGAFTDVKDGDDYASAINLLASLEVLKGFEDGTYNSAGSYTREQFAKILYVLVNGKDDNAAMYQGTAPFPDVDADRWSAGYITWAVNLGICNGRDDGNFWPTDVVKYAEACKMFLIAMGYSSTIYTYPYGFIDKASTLSLFDDVSGYTTFGDANRGTVAQMAYNALFAEAPRFGTYTAKEGETTTTNVKLLIMGAFGVTYEYSVLEATSNNAYDSGVFGEDQINLSYYDSGVENNKEVNYGLNGVYNYEDDVDALIGMTVKVWYKADESELGNMKIFMVEDSNKDKAYTVNPMDVDTGKTSVDSSSRTTLYFKENNTTRKLTVADEAKAIKFDGDLEAFPDFSDSKNVTDIVRAKTYKVIDRGNDGTADYIYVSNPQFGKVTSLTSSKISLTKLSGGTYLSGAKDILDDDDNVIITVADGLKKDDYALAYAKRAVVDGAVEDVYEVVKAEAASSVKFNRESGSNKYFGGTPYKILETVTVALGNTYDIYFNANGYIAYADEVDSETTGNWLLVTDAYNSANAADEIVSATVVGYLTDGTKKTLTLDIDEFDGKAVGKWGLTGIYDENTGFVDTASKWKNQVFTYTTNDDGYVTSLKLLVDDDNKSYVSSDLVSNVGREGNEDYSKYDDDRTQLTLHGGGKMFITSGTVIYNVYESTKVVVLKDTELPEFDADDGYVVTQYGTDGGEAVVLVIESGEKITGTSAKYGLVIDADKYAADKNDEYYYVLKVATGGEVVELTTANVDGASELNSDLTEAKFASNGDMIGYYKIVTNSAGKVTKLEDITGDHAQAQGVLTSIPNNKGFEAAGADAIEYGKDEDGNVTIKSVTGETSVYLYADKVGFYTIDAEPAKEVTSIDDGEDVSEATSASLIKSSIGDLRAIDNEDLIYVVDFITDKDGDVIEVFIYTTPVAGHNEPAPVEEAD